MFDCGDGTVRQMVQTRLKASKTRNVFITHLHSDHFFGLPSVGLEMKTVSGKRAHLFAPRGIRQRMSTVEYFCLTLDNCLMLTNLDTLNN